MKSFRFLAAAVALAALHATPAVAQPDPPPLVTADPPPVTKRLTDLERENVLLKARVAALEKVTPGLPRPAGQADNSTFGERYYYSVEAAKAANNPGYVIRPYPRSPGEVASAAPFEPCDKAGCSSTPTTPVTAAGTPAPTRTYGPEPWAAAGTNTAAGGVVTSGGISGCTAAGCSTGRVVTRGGWYLGKNLGR